MFKPENELGVVFLFGKYCAENDRIELLSIRSEFPDAAIRVYDGTEGFVGNEWRVEFEFVSSNFIKHGHDIRECDAVICWIDDLDGALPVPTIELSDEGIGHCALAKADDKDKEIFYWKSRAKRFEKMASVTKSQLSSMIDEEDDGHGYYSESTLEYFIENPSHSYRQAADKLGVSRRTVGSHMRSATAAGIARRDSDGLWVIMS
jgi:DNA-binding transcriptional ArsR family regulator